MKVVEKTSLKAVEKSSSLKLSKNHFDEISRRIYALCGIKLTTGKEELVKSRLAKRINALKLKNFDQYLNYLDTDSSGLEVAQMIDALTTNKTSFFREAAHFEYLRETIVPSLNHQERRLRVWSAACSSGEEPFTIAMVLRDAIKDIDRWDALILATDISNKVLASAREAVYRKEMLSGIPSATLHKNFTSARQPEGAWRVNDNLRRMVKFASLNLMGDWPMRGSFDVIFCRNVMIYFDKPTQQKLVSRFAQMLAPGGHLLVGHAESLTGSAGVLRYIQPATYVKE